MNFKDRILDVSIVPIPDGDTISVACLMMKEVTPYVKLENELMEKNRELIITNALASTFISSEDIGAVYKELLDRVMAITEMGMGWISIKEDDGKHSLKCSSGLSRDFIDRITSGELDYLIDRGISTREPFLVIETPEVEDIGHLKNEGVVFFVAIPLKHGAEAIGMLALQSRVEVEFDLALASLLSLIGSNLSLIAEKTRLFVETQRLTIIDPLTGLYNVRHLYEVLDAEVARADRYTVPFSIVLFDVDNFKQINDSFGHPAGDEVLTSVAEAMVKICRKVDVVARYGGEEFIVVLPNTPKDEAQKMAARIKEAVDGKTYLGEPSLRVTLSGGVASCPMDAEDSRGLMEAADSAMYKAKEMGKNRIVVHEKK